MERINIHNYESFLLDYIEGCLDSGLVSEMHTFLANHPTIAEEAEGLNDFKLDASSLVYPNTEDLYREKASVQMQENLMMLFSMAADGTLSAEDQLKLNAGLNQYPEHTQDYQAYLQTRLKVDNTIVFPYKASLKKVIPLYNYAAVSWMLKIAAVVILILFSLWFLIPSGIEELPQLSNMASVPINSKEEVSLPEQATTHNDAAPITVSPTDVSIIHLASPKASPLAAHKEEGETQLIPQLSSEERVAALPRIEPVLASQHLMRSIGVSDRQPYTMFRKTRYPDIRWLTTDPLYANVESNDLIWQASLGWLFGKDGKTSKARSRSLESPVRSFNLWGVANAGILAINLLTDNNIKLDKDLDDNGKVVAYALQNDGFQIARKRRME